MLSTGLGGVFDGGDSSLSCGQCNRESLAVATMIPCSQNNSKLVDATWQRWLSSSIDFKDGRCAKTCTTELRKQVFPRLRRPRGTASQP